MKQKVITVTVSTIHFVKEKGFHEYDFPEVSKFLNEGYHVEKVIPVTLSTSEYSTYSIIFVLEIN